MTEQEIQQKLAELNGWELDGNAIKKAWQFRDFAEAMRFINQVAELAEKHDHHPELFNVYNHVELRFSTHDAGGLTAKDFAIAREIDRISGPGE
ncbi:MAG: 4a-hydroxytetrahydrobiopterin dehydratase [candidate division KSB1 bacterium]|nr:4a-hydroxytetrahydrobiopterin dehydratase [candidate division KSB1 bacterium]MDQ7064150.1 4a-hydroxytetrahydrobiopterin dehydratase [candidate division KSB1 bacterium]